MKKIFSLLVLATLLLSIAVFAQQGSGQSGGQPEVTGQPEDSGNPLETGQGTQVVQATQNQGENKQLTVQQMTQKKAEIKEYVQQKQQEMSKEMESLNTAQRKVYENQNQVRLAVHALLEMKDTLGGIGPQVSEIARNFNNSLQSTIRAEEKIQTRSAFSRFFAGGDKKAAEELETEVTQNQARVQELKQLREQCQCDEETKTMLQEQIQNMEQEQTRLKELADKEKKSKGLFGWLWK